MVATIAPGRPQGHARGVRRARQIVGRGLPHPRRASSVGRKASSGRIEDWHVARISNNSAPMSRLPNKQCHDEGARTRGVAWRRPRIDDLPDITRAKLGAMRRFGNKMLLIVSTRPSRDIRSFQSRVNGRYNRFAARRDITPPCVSCRTSSRRKRHGCRWQCVAPQACAIRRD